MRSRQELIERALKELGVVAAGQTPDAEDVDVVEDEIDAVMSDLMVRNVYSWGDPDEYEDEAFIHLAKIIANSVARSFGVAPDDGVRIICEARLRMLIPVVLSGQPLRAEYY